MKHQTAFLASVTKLFLKTFLGKEVSHLATEGAGVLGMLANFNLLHHFPEGRTVTGTIFTHNPNLLGALSLLGSKPE